MVCLIQFKKVSSQELELNITARQRMAKSAYIHIPFCSHKCDFCDFAAFAGVDELSEEYCAAVCREIEIRQEREPNKETLETVFFGGGTPGYLEPRLIALIISKLRDCCGISAKPEITLETTPQSISESKCASWLSSGINRISIGIESLSDGELKAMGRDHSKEESLNGIRRARAAGYENIAVDLMYGLPEQTTASWENTLEELLKLEPDHLSAYALTIAVNSPLLRRYPLNSDKYPDEEEFEEMYYLLLRMCAEAGLEQYEIANFAKAGFESRHNLCYWRNEEYLAFGVSAHRYHNGKRSSNFRALQRYMREFDGVETEETIDPASRIKEAVFLGLRLREGLKIDEFDRKYGIDLLSEKAPQIDKLSRAGFMEFIDGRLRLTQKGVLVSNSVLSELI